MLTAEQLARLQARTRTGLHLVKADGDKTTACGEEVLIQPAKVGGMKCQHCTTLLKRLVAAIHEDAAKARVANAWVTGDLSYKLDDNQRRISERIDAAWKPRVPPAGATDAERLKMISPTWYYLNLARGFGKSVLCCVRALELGRKVKNGRVYYAAPEKKDALDIVRDTVELKLLEDCPKELRPKWSPSEYLYTFPGTDAVWRVKGVNNENADTLRGPGAHLFVLDEAGGMDEVEYVVRSVVDPMITRDGWHGKMLIATTPAKTAQHGSQVIFEECSVNGVSSTHTLLENGRLSWEDKARALRSCGEKDVDIPEILAGRMLPRTTTARREYFAMFVVDGASMIHPSWTDLEPELTVDIAA